MLVSAGKQDVCQGPRRVHEYANVIVSKQCSIVNDKSQDFVTQLDFST